MDLLDSLAKDPSPEELGFIVVKLAFVFATKMQGRMKSGILIFSRTLR